MAQALADVLDAEGYGTAIACDGREALSDLEKNHHPDLILLDMTMPVMDGWRFREAQQKLVEVY